MRILGIDPGSRKAGWGLLHRLGVGQKPQVLGFGVCRLDLVTSYEKRIGELAFFLDGLLKEHRPDICIVEDVFVKDQPHSALILGQARGAVLAICGLHQVPISHLSPASVKRHITGHGQAQKQQMALMVQHLLSLPKKPAEDAADALALALAYAHGVQPKKADGLLELAKAQGKI